MKKWSLGYFLRIGTWTLVQAFPIALNIECRHAAVAASSKGRKGGRKERRKGGGEGAVRLTAQFQKRKIYRLKNKNTRDLLI